MPSGRLVFVEGKIDKEILVSLVGREVTGVGERLIVQRRGSKNTLAMEAKTIAKEGDNDVYFIRDRDFDFLPPDDLLQPKFIKAEVMTIKFLNNQKVKREVKGWHWCRHEIENYLLTPEIVKRASYRKKSGYSFKITEYQDELTKAADKIRFYEAARWAIGKAKLCLPPKQELYARPIEILDKPIALPHDCSGDATEKWLINTTAAFYQKVSNSLTEETVKQEYWHYVNRFDKSFCIDLNKVLVWFSGKDILAALEPWCITKGYQNAAAFRETLANHLIEWLRRNPEEVCAILPEWNALIHCLKT
ncbi:MAG: hypothetical protein VSS75_005735 [Candidatus Parabeggiatoa sp.]|nr:hypothetical protein [Candidatus Parabeggiatoa sp.]